MQKRVLIRFACYLTVMLPLVWGVVQVEQGRFTDLAEAGSKGHVQSLARAYAEEVKATMGMIDVSLLQLRQAWLREPATFVANAPEYMRFVRERVPMAISIRAANGQLLYGDAASNQWPALALAPVSSSGIQDDILRLQGPARTPDGLWLVVFTRPILDASGALLGTIAAALPPTFFLRFYDSIDLGPNQSASVVRLAGTVLARADRRGDGYYTGRTLKNVAAAAFPSASGSLRRRSESDGVERYLGWHQLPEYGLVVTVGQGVVDAEARFTSQRHKMAGAGAVVALLLALLGLLAIGAAERRRRAVLALGQAEARMRRMAHEDALTGLPNRTLLDDRLQQAILTAQREGHKVGLIYFDLDKFKPINDRYGHAVGDQLLRMVAERVRAVLRESDTLARIGGDEFVVLLPRCARRSDAERVAATVHECLQRPFDDGVRQLQVSGSVGYAVYPDDGEHGAALLHRADLAMYDAKAQGRIAAATSGDLAA